ncbi:MAG: peptidoglycan-associated lipoprotein Pal [Victivallales bacterium]|nr:peptidoglycan-associated lipoprotein Pal [Victivallales bacterium]
MKSGNTLTIFLFAGMLLIGAGCSWFDNKIPQSNNNPIPGPASDAGIEPASDGTATKWTDSINIDSMGAATKDGWTPVRNVSLPTIYFAYESSVIGMSERQKLQQVAQYLKSNSEFGLIIEGNCDERGSAEYNRALGERRAIAVRDYLMSSGINAERFKTISYGEDRPAVKGSSETAYAKNRRADLVLARMR